MTPLTPDNCTAFDIIDELGEGMDFIDSPMSTKWKCYLTQQAYDILKGDPEDYIYAKDGCEYVKVWDNHIIPFVIHMRIAGIDNSILDKEPYSLGCRRDIDVDA